MSSSAVVMAKNIATDALGRCVIILKVCGLVETINNIRSAAMISAFLLSSFSEE